ncbi:MAG: hypothetical protein ACTHME_07180 [Candidatus Nitrosocosmicus sp.]
MRKVLMHLFVIENMEKNDQLLYQRLKDCEETIESIYIELIDLPSSSKDIKLQRDCDEIIKYIYKIINERIVIEEKNELNK